MGILRKILAPILEKGKEEFRVQKTLKGNGKVFYAPQWKYPSGEKWEYFYHGHPDSTDWKARWFATEQEAMDFIGRFTVKTVESIPYNSCRRC